MSPGGGDKSAGRTYGIGSVVGRYSVPRLGQPCAAVAVKDRPPARRRDRQLVVPRVERLDGATRIVGVAERELGEHVGWDRVAQEEREVCERGGAGCAVGGGGGRWRWQARLAWQSHRCECLSPCRLSVSSPVSASGRERRRESAGVRRRCCRDLALCTGVFWRVPSRDLWLQSALGEWQGPR